ncbi:MAG: hypothetical protein UDS46_05915 [Bacteroidales bacterium]|nr:hypothetical protein [Bacteroidales bacterium]
MNKNLFKTFAIAAMAVLAGACAKEQVASGDGETVEMTFNVDVPETTITTKGLSDAAQVDELVFQVFLTGTKDENKHYENKPVPELTQVVPVVDKKATVRVNLVKGQTYSYAFWAQSKGTGYYDTSDLRAVKMNTDKVKANDPEMDAFYSFREYETASKSYSEPITLYRALAQINFGAKALDRSDALQATKSSVTLSKVPDIFHPFWKTSEISEGKGEITYASNAVVSDEKLVIGDEPNKTKYDYLATAYVFANKDNDKILIDASATITLSNGRTTKIAVPNAPIKVNCRTNILGDLLNVDGVWNVTVDEEFKGGDKIYDPLGSELKKGSAVTLTEDYSAFTPSGVVIPMKVVSSLDLNGYTFKNENGTALDVRGSLTINGSGKVLCEGPVGEANAAVFVQDGGKVVINDGYYYSKNGNSCIYVQAGNKTGRTITIGGEVKPLYYGGGIVEINGGVFEADANKFVLNQNDYIENESCFSVKGGIFVGFNPAEVNECHGKVTSFVADGYKAVETTYEGKPAWKVEAIPAVTTQEAFNSAIAEANATVVLAAGTYDMPSTIADGVTIIGNGEGTVLDMVLKNTTCKNASFKNVKILCEATTNYKGFIGSDNTVFENCTFTGKHFSYGKETYKKCHFIQEESDYNMWVYGKDVDYIDCTFEGKGKLLHVYNEGNPLITVNIQGCKFISTVLDKPAINIKGTCGTTILAYTVNIDNCTVSGAFPEINGGLWQVDKPATAEKNKITVNVKGKKVY